MFNRQFSTESPAGQEGKLFLRIIGAVSLGLLTSCNSPQKENKGYEEAGKIHLEAIEIAKGIEPKVDSLKVLIQTLQNLESPSEQDIRTLRSYLKIADGYQWFKNNHVEVPGLEHDHHHDHGDHDHHHDHSAPLEMTEEDMLTVQTEFRDSILKVRDRLIGLNL